MANFKRKKPKKKVSWDNEVRDKSPVEKEVSPAAKPKKKKPYAIYYKYADEYWEKIKQSPYKWVKHNDWQLHKRYFSEKARDNALEALNKNQVKLSSLIKHITIDFRYVYCKGEDIETLP
jgi:hypothetical protein